MANGNRIPLSFSDIGKIAVATAGVAAAWVAVSQIRRLTDFVLGTEEKVPFEPNDVLLVRMKGKGQFPRSKEREYKAWQEIIRKLTNDRFIPKIPFTNYFVAKRKGGASFDWRAPEKSDAFFSDQVLVRISLEFPPGLGNTRKRKEALLAISQKRAESVYGGQMKKILVGLQSLGGVPDFEEGSPEATLAAFFEPV